MEEFLSRYLGDHPASIELAAALMVFPLEPHAWEDASVGIAIGDGETIGRALYEIGRFETARPWFERAVEAKEQEDSHGQVDHASLGRSLREGASCLRSVGRLEQAQAWEEEASRLES